MNSVSYKGTNMARNAYRWNGGMDAMGTDNSFLDLRELYHRGITCLVLWTWPRPHSWDAHRHRGNPTIIWLSGHSIKLSSKKLFYTHRWVQLSDLHQRSFSVEQMVVSAETPNWSKCREQVSVINGVSISYPSYWGLRNITEKGQKDSRGQRARGKTTSSRHGRTRDDEVA